MGFGRGRQKFGASLKSETLRGLLPGRRGARGQRSDLRRLLPRCLPGRVPAHAWFVRLRTAQSPTIDPFSWEVRAAQCEVKNVLCLNVISRTLGYIYPSQPPPLLPMEENRVFIYFIFFFCMYTGGRTGEIGMPVISQLSHLLCNRGTETRMVPGPSCHLAADTSAGLGRVGAFRDFSCLSSLLIAATQLNLHFSVTPTFLLLIDFIIIFTLALKIPSYFIGLFLFNWLVTRFLS